MNRRSWPVPSEVLLLGRGHYQILRSGQPWNLGVLQWRAADSVDGDGNTLLHLAIAQGRADLLQLLLEFEPDIELPSRSGSTPLEAAAAAGEALIAELLLSRKASTERSENSTWGPIHLAAGGGHMEVRRLLLLKGANVDALTRDGNTALHLAVEERRRDCARLLLSSGATADMKNSGDGDTPLHICAGVGDEQMVKLLQKGANKDVRNWHGKTPYDVAAEYGHTRLFDSLRLRDSLCVAARKGEVRSINRLLENGAAINGRDQHGWTALHRSSFKGKIDSVRTLIEKGIEVDARDEDGYTALHCAVESGHADVIELLVKKGADVEARTNKGVTAIQIADSLHYLGITRILIQGGATRDGGRGGNSQMGLQVGGGGVHFGNGLKAREQRETEDMAMLKKKAANRRTRARRSSIDRPIRS